MATDDGSIRRRRAISRQRATETEARATSISTQDHLVSAQNRWQEFRLLYGLPDRLFIDTSIPEERFWLLEIIYWFYDHWVSTRTGMGGEGTMKGDTIKENLLRIFQDMDQKTGQMLKEAARPLATALAKGHDKQCIDMVGIRPIRKAAPITRGIMDQMAAVTWRRVLNYVNQNHVNQFAENLELATAVMWNYGIRSANVLWTDARSPFHSNWHWHFGDLTFLTAEGQRLEPTGDNLDRLQEEGGIVALRHKASKGDPLGHKHGAKARHFPIVPKGQLEGIHREGGNLLLRHTIKYAREVPRDDWESRPLFVDPRKTDPETQAPMWMTKEAYQKPFYLLLQAAFIEAYNIRLPISTISSTFRLHGFRAFFQSGHETTRTPQHIIEDGGGWAPDSTARLGYSRQQIRAQLEAFNSLTRVQFACTLPPQLATLQAALEKANAKNRSSPTEPPALADTNTHTVASPTAPTEGPKETEETERGRTPPPPPKRRRCEKAPALDSLATLFARSPRQHHEEEEESTTPQAQERERRILNETRDSHPIPATPKGWLNATIVIASSDSSLPARSRAAVQPGEHAERARVRSLEWDEEEQDFIATLEFEQPPDQEREGVFTESMLFEDLERFERVEETQEATRRPCTLPVQPEQEHAPEDQGQAPRKPPYKGRHKTIRHWYLQDTPIMFDQDMPKKNLQGVVKSSWRKYSVARTIAQAIELGATTSDLAYDLNSNRLQENPER